MSCTLFQFQMNFLCLFSSKDRCWSRCVADNSFGIVQLLKHPIQSEMESRHKQPNQTILKVFSFFQGILLFNISHHHYSWQQKKYCVKIYFPVRQKMVSSSYKEKKRLLMQEWIENKRRENWTNFRFHPYKNLKLHQRVFINVCQSIISYASMSRHLANTLTHSVTMTMKLYIEFFLWQFSRKKAFMNISEAP